MAAYAGGRMSGPGESTGAKPTAGSERFWMLGHELNHAPHGPRGATQGA